LPERVFGRTVTKWTRLGRAIAPRLSSTCFITAFSSAAASSGVATLSAFLTTAKAIGI
jgi:hypothetical protein